MHDIFYKEHLYKELEAEICQKIRELFRNCSGWGLESRNAKELRNSKVNWKFFLFVMTKDSKRKINKTSSENNFRTKIEL